METIERPTRRQSRAWLAVAGLSPLPVLVCLIFDESRTALLVAGVASGLLLAVAALVWAAQRAGAQRRDFEDRLEEWAADQAVTEERMRIARDLHDLSSHGLGLITVRAAATEYLHGPGADAERQRAMLDIEHLGRSTTAELRRMLALLRTPDAGPAPLRPADTLGALPGIIREAERGGLTIQVTIERVGDEHDDYGGIAQSAQLAVCAVVREALTNVVRHAGPTTARLSVARKENVLSVTVDDDGKQARQWHPGWRDAPGAGHGLIGLRERVEAQGGTLAASPTRDGFRLHASIPVGADE